MKYIAIVIISLMWCSMGCEDNNNGLVIKQDVSISNYSDIKNCDIKFNLWTFVWQNNDIIYSLQKFDISELDLEKAKNQQRDKALGLTRCISALKRMEANK